MTLPKRQPNRTTNPGQMSGGDANGSASRSSALPEPVSGTHPTLEFRISKVYNLLHLLYETGGKVSGSTPYAESLRRITELQSYSPATGLWGYFEEALAASEAPDDLQENLSVACRQLQSTITGLVDQALPVFTQELEQRQQHLERRRQELHSLWYPKEPRLMQVIAETFGTPWQGEDAETIGLSLIYSHAHTARSRPLMLGVNGQSTGLLLCNIVHELLHRNSFGSAKGGLWSKIRLFCFSAGVPAWLEHEISHAVITWAGCTISAEIWDLDANELYHSFYEGTVNPQAASLDVMAELWPALLAGELKTITFIQRAVEKTRVALDSAQG